MNKHYYYIFLGGVSLVAICLVGCDASTPETGTIYQRLQSKDPSVRIDAIVQAGNLKDRKTVPLLVDRLGDTQSDVRLFAGVALKKITGQNFGWQGYDPPEKRNQAIRRWQQWVKKEFGKPESMPATSKPAGQKTTTQAPATTQPS